ncbi:hypothetical protein HX846_23060, partial [Pseudomonas sp. K5002]|nr:hypothetical protein [Pseudomonas sp. K5002]
MTLTGITALLSATAHAGNGVHINANADGQCVSLNDPQNNDGNAATYLAQNLIFKDQAGGKCNSATKGSQTDSVLFYRPGGVSGVGATSLTLGGELFVNSGRVILGQPGGNMAIGNESTQANADGAAIGHGAQGLGRWGMAAGFQAKSLADYAHAFGYNAQASNQYATAIGANTTAAGERATAVGAGASASGGGAF